MRDEITQSNFNCYALDEEKIQSIYRSIRSMKLAYADPPYMWQAKRHYSHDPSGIPAEEVDYPALIRQLKNLDGWALSASSPSIFELVPMINEVFPIGTVRVGAWVKPFCSWKPTHRVQYAWEPVFYVPTRDKGNKDVPSVRDFVSSNITMRKGTHGAKPDPFCDWILEVLGHHSEDEIFDLFPGSGAFTRAIERKTIPPTHNHQSNKTTTGKEQSMAMKEKTAAATREVEEEGERKR